LNGDWFADWGSWAITSPYNLKSLDFQRRGASDLAGWDAGQKRTVAMTMQKDYPVTEICEVLDLPRSTFYHHSTAQDDTALRQVLRELSGEYPTYGYRRLAALLQRAG
jgi:hypothetical protein